jgi:hypothetical protein
MTIHQKPRDVLTAFKPRLAPPPERFNEDDSLLVEIRDKCSRAQNIRSLRKPLVSLLGEIIRETQLEDIARDHPGMIGNMISPSIVTVCICPPIPDRRFDWCAYYDGDEEGGPRGYGATEQEAVNDLLENSEAPIELAPNCEFASITE